ncbi:Imm49 family immunity protein [Streptomyces sp. 3N207]|uniref:Imm49 family immunity protein n=1 Tax=Streptomyces sp. 3N207 TaxID=3457417 RepID=UPI003FD2BEC3
MTRYADMPKPIRSGIVVVDPELVRQPVALFHRLITRDPDAFTEALAHHGTYWSDSTTPRARVALGPLAMTSLAYGSGFPVNPKQPCLPTYLLNRERIEAIPG